MYPILLSYFQYRDCITAKSSKVLLSFRQQNASTFSQSAYINVGFGRGSTQGTGWGSSLLYWFSLERPTNSFHSLYTSLAPQLTREKLTHRDILVPLCLASIPLWARWLHFFCPLSPLLILLPKNSSSKTSISTKKFVIIWIYVNEAHQPPAACDLLMSVNASKQHLQTHPAHVTTLSPQNLFISGFVPEQNSHAFAGPACLV